MRFAPGFIAQAPAQPQLELGAEFTMETWVFLEKPQPRACLLGKMHPSGRDPYFSYVLGLSGDDRVYFAQSTGETGELCQLHWSAAPGPRLEPGAPVERSERQRLQTA
jgi:hypothetical protein